MLGPAGQSENYIILMDEGNNNYSQVNGAQLITVTMMFESNAVPDKLNIETTDIQFCLMVYPYFKFLRLPMITHPCNRQVPTL